MKSNKHINDQHENTSRNQDGLPPGSYWTYPPSGPNRQLEGGLRTKGLQKTAKIDEPLVTIITVCFNASATIRKAIDSVIHQTYGNIEYLIIDGASTDSTAEILKEYQDSIDYFISEPDEGLYEAMNKGIALAQGDFILILNADDWYTSDCVSSLMDAKYSTGADIVSSLAYYVSNETTTTLRCMPFDASTRLRMPLRHETMLIPAHVYKLIGPYNQSYTIIADLELVTRIYDHSLSVYQLERPLLHFSTDGVSNTNREQLFTERRRLLKSEFDFLSDTDLERLGNLSLLTKREAIDLYNRHIHNQDFSESLRLYIVDRTLVDKNWRDAPDTLPSDFRHRPQVSIVLPLYNAEETLASCIESIQEQTLSALEIICIDDQSPDRSKQIAENIGVSDPRIRVYQNSTNRRLGATRNRGIQLARGDYIFHVDPDDALPPKALELLVTAAQHHGSELTKGSYIREQYIHGRREKTSIVVEATPNSTTVANTNLRATPRLLNSTEGHWAYLYRSDFARRIPYPTDLKMGQDSIFLVNALFAAKTITLIPDVIYKYQANPLSAMNRFNFSKFIDALEWRRRAWLVLSKDPELAPIGERLLQLYWSEDFFRSLAQTVQLDQFSDFVSRFLRVFQAANLSPISTQSPPWMQKLFTSFKDQDPHSTRKLLLNVSNQADFRSGQHEVKKRQLDRNSIDHSDEPKAMSPSNAPLKIATLSTLDFGGAGIGTLRRTAALRQIGLDVSVIVLKKSTSFEYVKVLPTYKEDASKATSEEVWPEISKRTELHSGKVENFSASEFFSEPVSVTRSEDLRDIVADSDIVHMHWVVGMLDHSNFDKIFADKPVVWTLADMNAFTGGCHYSEGCQNFVHECNDCPLLGTQKDRAHRNWKTKQLAYKMISNLTIICPSAWLAEQVQRSSLLGDRPVRVIPNPAPTEDFFPFNKVTSRIRLGLPVNKKLLLFGADDLNNHRKGGDLLLATLDQLKGSEYKDDIELILFGSNSLSTDFPIHKMGHVRDTERLATIYSAADAFLFPSREDNSPLTVTESLLCGTPVIAFPVGNIPQVVKHQDTGFIANYLDPQSLANGAEWALTQTIEESIRRSLRCRSSVIDHHDPRISVAKHLQVYQYALGSTESEIDTATLNLPTIYVVTPCRNVAKTIDDTIESVVTQRGPFRIVYHIQDGGSTDGTIEILKGWKVRIDELNRHRFHGSISFSWSSENDTGMYDAILRAFNRLPIRPNEFMTWINGDDILLQGTLDIISQIQYSLPTVSWVGSHTHNILEDGRINVTRPNPTPTAVIAAGLCDGHKHHWTHLQQEGTFFRKSLWDKCSHVLKDFKLAGDWALWRKFAENEEYYQCSKPLGAFRIRAGQLSSTSRTEYETEVDNVIPMETRDLEFETFYSLRRQLHANVIEIDNRNKVVAISKITDKVRDTFYQRHRRSQRSMGAAFKEETVLKDSIVNKASILEHPDHFTYARKSHWEYFRGLDVELFGEPLVPTQVDLKRYQDLLAFLFIKQNIRKGSRLLEIGGGNSRILKKLSADYECWNVDKLEGVGNGPVSADIHGVTLVRDYIGNFNSQLPNDYFDFVFSVSVLEHVPKGNPGLFENIVRDINRVAKDGAFSLQLFDIVFKGQSTRVFHDLIRYIFANVQTMNKLVEPEEANASQDIYFLSEDVYENIWFKYTKQPYKQFGRPTSINILWKKSG